MSDDQPNPLFTPFKPTEQPPMPFASPPTEPVPPKRERKPRTISAPKAKPASKAKRKPRAPKQPVPEQDARSVLDLQVILRASAALKDEDYAAFEALLNTFDKMNKPQGQRVLAALGKVFA